MNIDTDWKDLVPRLEADLLARDQASVENNRDEEAWRSAERLLRVYGQIFLRTGSILRPEDVEDIVQDIVLKLQSRQIMRRLRVAGSPAGYVAVMMKNAAIDLVRRRQRELALVQPIEEETRSAIADESDARDLDQASRLKESLRLLRPEDRDLLRMRFWKNMSIAEMSETLGISYSATAVRLFRTLKRVRESMEM
jgi:RNA polymerase sigma factor (sigma-70 family)